MTETVEVLDLSQYAALEGKKVNLTYLPEGSEEPVTHEGTLMAVAPGQGVMFRRRGSQRPDLIDTPLLRAIVLIQSAPKKVSAKKLRTVTLDTAREHLADRHGYTLTSVNGATQAQALLAHQQIDHGDLGHTHGDPESEQPTEAGSTEEPDF